MQRTFYAVDGIQNGFNGTQRFICAANDANFKRLM